MSIKDLFLFNLESDMHLRDAEHARQIYTQNNFAFAPKAKYMYHVVFQPSDEVGNTSTSNTFSFQKELGILVKSADLPSYRVSVENKQQYNRKKNVQTRLDYQDCRISLHDDNLGAVRAMLEEYYKYYFADGNRDPNSANGAYEPRDKYFAKVPNYGLNNRKRNPFFKSIKIYQLARREWFCYTLINPLLSAWDHGTVESATGDMNEAHMTVAYEGVYYTSGNVKQDTPVGFADASVGYDVEPSPLGYIDDAMDGMTGGGGILPALIGAGTSALLGKAFGGSSKGGNLFKQIGTGLIGGVVSNVLSQDKIPVVDSQNILTSSILSGPSSRQISSSSILASLDNPEINASVMPALINTGAIPNVGINEYNSASVGAKASYEAQIRNQIASGNAGLTQVASNAINDLGP
jgi:hypothetical protein